MWYHPKITYENIIQKDMNKFHIQAIQILISYKNWFASNTHMIKPVLYRISYLPSSFANYELAFPPSRGAEFLLVFATYKFYITATKMYEIYPPTSLISFILNSRPWTKLDHGLDKNLHWKIRTSNAIFWISLGIFRDYSQKNFF